jgi:hypothetical protein
MKNSMLALVVAATIAVASNASAHGYAVYMPVVPAPVAGYYTTGPVMPYAPVITTAYYAPPAVYYPAPAPAPYYVATPVIAPVPVPAPVAVAPVAVAPVYGPKVVVRPKVYVRGEPVRNVLRAVTP